MLAATADPGAARTRRPVPDSAAAALRLDTRGRLDEPRLAAAAMSEGELRTATAQRARFAGPVTRAGSMSTVPRNMSAE
jgi:hypothetical protein